MMTDARTLKILKTHVYPAYQFFAHYSYEDRDSKECMKYLVMTIVAWLRSRTGDHELLGELDTTDEANYFNIPDKCFLSCHLDEAYKLDVISIIQDGIWTMRLIEPDMDRNNRKGIIGRSFDTNIAIRIMDDNWVACGIRTDVYDPENAEKEVPFAYRPAFVKRIFLNSAIRARENNVPIKRACMILNNEDSFKKLSESYRLSAMPSVVFLGAFDFEAISETLKQIDAQMGFTGNANSILNQASTIMKEPEIISHHLLGYARVWFVPLNKLQMAIKYFSELNISCNPGDVLFLEPKRFGGKISIFHYQEEQTRLLREDYYAEMQEKAFVYSKHKKYDFGEILFIPDAEKLARERREETIRTDAQSKTTEELLEEMVSLDADNEKLKNMVYELQRKNEIQEQKLRRLQEGRTLVLRLPEIDEYFTDEMRDLVLTVLKTRADQIGEETRATELLKAIVDTPENGLTGEGIELFERIKAIFFRNKNMTDSDFSELAQLGIIKEEEKQGDGHIRLHFKSSKRIHSIASTGSDNRGMKNALSDFVRTESVYRI